MGQVAFDGVKVFSATKAREREGLGERITKWMHETPVEVTDCVVTQSSDREFHCLSFTVFYLRRDIQPDDVRT